MIGPAVVPYIGTWIETIAVGVPMIGPAVVPYIGTWIETRGYGEGLYKKTSYLI